MKQYKTLSEWRNDNPREYAKARREGWIDELCKINGWVLDARVSIGYWNSKENVLASAKKYKTRSEWAKGREAGAYNAAKNNDWFDECTKHMVRFSKPSGYWHIKANVINEARKYKTTTQWQNDAQRSYTIAKDRGWFDECVEHMEIVGTPQGYWNIKENVLASAKKYKTRSEWAKGPDSTAYMSAKKNDWFDECTTHMEYAHTPAGYWTKDRCIEEAKKYKTYTEWGLGSISSIDAARRDGWIDEIIKLNNFNSRPRWTKERCLEEALKYNTISAWQKGSNGSQKAARKNNWFEEVSKHMYRGTKWTLEKCIEESKKYKTKTEWRKGSRGSYNVARANGWYEECKEIINNKHEKI
tara:strand:+ start:277 stop:1344 length:1068 start_codon:yes stop_codon:yes gene_type:complete